MTTRMTDPMDARKFLQLALDRKTVVLEDCAIHPDIKMIEDEPARGTRRFTYVKLCNGKVHAISLFVTSEPLHGLPCYALGYAVAESARGQGLATDIVQKGIDEFKNAMVREGIRIFYIEAVVGISNLSSKKLAQRLISDHPIKGTDSESGEQVFQYIKLIET